MKFKNGEKVSYFTIRVAIGCPDQSGACFSTRETISYDLYHFVIIGIIILIQLIHNTWSSIALYKHKHGCYFSVYNQRWMINSTVCLKGCPAACNVQETRSQRTSHHGKVLGNPRLFSWHWAATSVKTDSAPNNSSRLLRNGALMRTTSFEAGKHLKAPPNPPKSPN